MTDPDEYVRDNRESLVEVLNHGTDPFARSLALAALVEFAEEPDIEKVRHEIDQAIDQQGSA